MPIARPDATFAKAYLSDSIHELNEAYTELYDTAIYHPEDLDEIRTACILDEYGFHERPAYICDMEQLVVLCEYKLVKVIALQGPKDDTQSLLRTLQNAMQLKVYYQKEVEQGTKRIFARGTTEERWERRVARYRPMQKVEKASTLYSDFEKLDRGTRGHESRAPEHA